MRSESKSLGSPDTTVAAPYNHRLFATLGAHSTLDIRMGLKKESGDKVHIATNSVCEQDAPATTVYAFTRYKPQKAVVIRRGGDLHITSRLWNECTRPITRKGSDVRVPAESTLSFTQG